MNRKSLGKGLDALIPGIGQYGARSVQEVDVSSLRGNPSQPRHQMGDESLAELTQSIKAHGVIQPVLAQKTHDGFEIIAGERRWRAAIKAGLQTIPVILGEFNDGERLEIALIENLQREDLNPIDLAKGLKRLVEEFDLTQEEVAQRVGKKRPTITNLLRLLDLADEVQSMVENNQLSPGHARVLVGIADQETQALLAHKIVNENLSVRDTEQLVRQFRKNHQVAEKQNNHQRSPGSVSRRERNCQELLTRFLAARVRVGKKRIVIEYSSEDELGRIYSLILQDQEPF